MLSLYFYK